MLLSILNIIGRVIILSVGISVAAYLVPGINVTGVGAAVKAGLLLGVLNAFIKPVVLILTLPINLLTLGLFTFVINGILLWAVGHMVSGFEVSGFFAAVLGGILISLLSIILNRFS